MRNSLQDRVFRDTIRRVHLASGNQKLLRSITSLLASNNNELRSNSIESFVLWNQHVTQFDVPNFFAGYHFPKLRRLELTACAIPSSLWDHLISRTSVLTTLALDFTCPSSTPTTPRLLSILASNPALQKVTLIGFAVSYDGGGKPSFRVQLRHLKELRLQGPLPDVIGLLHQLDYPGNMEKLSLNLHVRDVADISQIIGPYLRNHLQRHDRPRNGLNFLVSSSYRTHSPCGIAFHAGDAGGINFSAPDRVDAFVMVTMRLSTILDRNGLKRAALDLITHVPREEVVYLQARDNPIDMEDASTQFPNVRALALDTVPLSAAFPNPNLVGDGGVFPSLEHIFLQDVVVDDGDWNPLMIFLARRVSSGNRLDTLMIANSSSMCPEAIKGIRGLVRELRLEG